MSKELDDLITTLQNINPVPTMDRKYLSVAAENKDSEQLLRSILRDIPKDKYKNLVSILLNNIGLETYLGRPGDVNLRMDAIGITDKNCAVIAIPNESSLDSARDILDWAAVVCSRYKTELKDIHGIIVLKEIPNMRTELWEVLQDIKNVLDFSITVIPFYALLRIWIAGRKLNLHLFDPVAPTELRLTLEKIIETKVHLDNPSSLIEAPK
tara:strand:+ start:459 stop:1091 length:633 start_codon:yes stop_codon:yes gene_type:complete